MTLDPSSIVSFLVCLSAGFAYINHRFIKMPFVIGLFFLSTIISLAVLSGKLWLPKPYFDLVLLVEQTHISQLILEDMLGFLLFAGALHTNWSQIRVYFKQIALFAVLGVLLSMILVAVLFYGLCQLFQLNIDFIYCLLFGALISPTDPIAVLGILVQAKTSKKIESIIVGESLFNDGVGVVIFIALLEMLNAGTSSFDFKHFGFLFFQEAIGGVFFGICAGYVLHTLLKSIDHYETEVLLTLAFVLAGYQLCGAWHLSGALAMVVMGLLVGNYKSSLSMSDQTQEYMHKFWEMIDVILNAILFIMIALVLVVIEFKTTYIWLGIFSVFIVLLARVIVVFLPVAFLPKFINLNRREAKLIIWGGLRGSLSIALVLSLPNTESRNILLIATYICVLFSIMVQGLSIGKMAQTIH